MGEGWDPRRWQPWHLDGGSRAVASTAASKSQRHQLLVHTGAVGSSGKGIRLLASGNSSVCRHPMRTSSAADTENMDLSKDAVSPDGRWFTGIYS
ncbi:hypothetical protein MRX96_043485 [Rhipicephalus microplus]